MSNFTFYNAGASKFYGGNVGNADGITLSDDNINPSAGAGSQTFKFRSVAGSPASFKDFNEFRIFDDVSKQLIGVATVPSDLFTRTSTSAQKTPTQTNIGSTTAPSQSTTSSQSPSPSALQNSSARSASCMLSVGVGLAYFLFF